MCKCACVCRYISIISTNYAPHCLDIIYNANTRDVTAIWSPVDDCTWCYDARDSVRSQHSSLNAEHCTGSWADCWQSPFTPGKVFVELRGVVSGDVDVTANNAVMMMMVVTWDLSWDAAMLGKSRQLCKRSITRVITATAARLLGKYANLVYLPSRLRPPAFTAGYSRCLHAPAPQLELTRAR